MHVVFKRKTFSQDFLSILKHLLQNIYKILKKYVLANGESICLLFYVLPTLHLSFHFFRYIAVEMEEYSCEYDECKAYSYDCRI